jgi:uncharacterized protein YraI
MTRPITLAALLLGTVGLAALAASPSSAEPATTVAYPPGAAATRYTGYAFDTCTAPPASTIRAWRASPYRALGIYIGGVTRSCEQPELTPGWVRDVSGQGWRLVPIYKGLQPWCGGRPTDAKITPDGATSEGTAAGVDAVVSARALGILPGSGLYLDIENYLATDTACRTGVLQFTSGYTRALHRRGYLSGVYANLSSGAKHLAQAYTSPSYARPDALWIARYDRSSALTGWAGVPDSRWAVHQRAKQYRGGHDETYGGVTLNIDNDRFDAPVATVAYPYTVTSTTALNARRAPSTASSVVTSYPAGATVRAVCQTAGSTVGTTRVWDRLDDGTYVSDFYVSTPSNTTYSAPLPRCRYPFQVTAPTTLNKRTGPGTGFPTAGTVPTGGLAWVDCQGPGTRVGSTSVWDRLGDGRWVSDYFVATPGRPGYSPPVPRC